MIEKKYQLALRFLILIFPLFVLYYTSFKIPFLQQALISQVVYLLNVFGIQFQVQGFQIILENFSSQITYDCTGWIQFYLFGALIFIPPGVNLIYRLKGLLLLIPLYIYNTLRIVLSIYIGSVSYSVFLPVHYFLWNLVFLVLVFLFWYWWFISYKKPKNKRR